MKMMELWPRAVFGPTKLMQVRIPLHRDAVIRLGAGRPVARELVAGQSRDREVLHVDARVDDETRTQDDAVDRSLDPVVGDDAVLGHLTDPGGHEFDVVAPEHRVPLV